MEKEAIHKDDGEGDFSESYIGREKPVLQASKRTQNTQIALEKGRIPGPSYVIRIADNYQCFFDLIVHLLHTWSGYLSMLH